ncbi:protoporphyrinogen oxidase [Shouchella shacheensis]|uniref:protoporphyrinogen oxidase n=1 Tax=Shouchella shacheensis TaxID=1649580 RepID=UPI00073FF0EF|nr:protoporphyrinogen oxidase [Shouchella shacheensis]
MKQQRVAIIGAGITGLSAAYQLEKANQEKGRLVEYHVFEASERVGGKIKTYEKDGFVMEGGPDSFLERKESMGRLAREVGLSDTLVRNETGQAFVLKDEQLFPIPGGAVMGVPTDLEQFEKTELISEKGKQRALEDLDMDRVTPRNEDISLGDFFGERLGDEMVTSLIEPLLGGIYGGNIYELSMRATFPSYLTLEETYGSLIKGLQATRESKPSTKKHGMFLTVNTGLQSFANALANQLAEGALRLKTPVELIEKRADGFELTFQDGTHAVFSDCIVTTPPHHTAKMLRSYSIFDVLKDMDATSVATVILAFKEEAVKNEREGTGFVVARGGDEAITACTWTNKKWPHTAPPGYTLLRCYVGRPDDSDIVFEDDEKMVAQVLIDLESMMEIEGEPEFYQVTRWPSSMPQYKVGHRERLAKLQEEVRAALPGLHLCGAAFDGVGLPDCIDQGERTANEILAAKK